MQDMETRELELTREREVDMERLMAAHQAELAELRKKHLNDMEAALTEQATKHEDEVKVRSGEGGISGAMNDDVKVTHAEIEKMTITL